MRRKCTKSQIKVESEVQNRTYETMAAAWRKSGRDSSYGNWGRVLVWLTPGGGVDGTRDMAEG